MTFRNLSLYLIFALVFTSCGETYFYEKTYELPDNQWSYADTLNFEVDITDTIKTYNLIKQLHLHTYTSACWRAFR